MVDAPPRRSPRQKNHAARRTSDRIDARMFAEEAVLVQERRLHELRRNAIERCEDAIFFVTTQRHPELAGRRDQKRAAKS